jgi:exonuclease VII small subunit
MKSVGDNAKTLITGFSAIATSAFSLYKSFESIQQSGIALDRANLMVLRSTESLDQAQKHLNEAIAKYGSGSAEAKDAADKLAIAQDALSLANERAGQAQQNVNNAAIQMALMVIPTAITAIGGFQGILTSLHITLKMLETVSIIGIVAGIMTIVAALVIAYQKCEWFRNGVNAVGSAIYDFFVPSTQAATKSVEDLTAALKAGVGYNAQFADAHRIAAQVADDRRAAEEKLAKETYDLTEALTSSWREQRAAADTNFLGIKKAFDAAFNAGDFNKAIGVVQDFASKYGLTLKDAMGIMDDFAEKIKKIPKTIEEELVGKAQADLQTFKDCSTGKFADISGDSAKAMETLVNDTNDLIAHGLVGQAQDNIQAFVTCATDKQAKMVSDIDGYLKDMYKNYDENTAKIQELLKWRLALTWGQPGSDIFTAINLASGSTAKAKIGPESILGHGFTEDLTGAGTTVVQGPLLIVEGSLDRKTAAYVIDKMEGLLKNVVVEPSSVSGSSTHKQIRFGSRK